ncbi:MAG TPA: hypothetical protein VNA88_14655 [Candidatus Kapabacteria bacterium]|jgi:hypothetical protein|nr:hypothetical protein [Candidatus Kapabacteria bacterium]
MTRPLTTVVTGTIVTGRYVRETSYTTEIELTMPPPLVRFRVSWPASRQTTLGRTTSETVTKPSAILGHLYHVAVHLHRHREQIVESYAALEVSIAMSLDIEKGIVPDELFGSMKEMKKMLLVDGDQTEVDHHDDLVDLRIGHSGYHERVRALRDHWFRQMFRREIEPEVQVQIEWWIMAQRAGMAG